jgi:hypothetical protein
MNGAGSDYEVRQRSGDAEYMEAWKALSPEQLAELKANGIAGPDCGRENAPDHGRVIVGREKDILETCDHMPGMSENPDIAEAVDKLPEKLREEFGLSVPQSEKVAAFLDARVHEATVQTHSLLLARIVGFFLSGGENLQARAHGLAHAVPRLAALSGYPSLRASAKACAVSVEWISRVREKWCRLLGMPIPEESTKSASAIAKYSELQTTQHWRTRKCSNDNTLTGEAKTQTPRDKKNNPPA